MGEHSKNIRRTENHTERLAAVKEGWETSGPLPGCSPSKLVEKRSEKVRLPAWGSKLPPKRQMFIYWALGTGTQHPGQAGPNQNFLGSTSAKRAP
ncbi:hypothetical protein TNCV_1953221 [Trichonephila clavipes]|nr:hypothetical protein TNCV_1953221 [Trichonephila clavipes]